MRRGKPLSCVLEAVLDKHTVDWPGEYRGKSWRLLAASACPAAVRSWSFPRARGSERGVIERSCSPASAWAPMRAVSSKPTLVKASARAPAPSPAQAGHSIRGRKVPWRRGGAQGVPAPIMAAGGQLAPALELPNDCPLGALARAVANVELTGAQALIGDVGCEKVGQGKQRPQEGNGVMTPRERP